MKRLWMTMGAMGFVLVQHFGLPVALMTGQVSTSELVGGELNLQEEYNEWFDEDGKLKYPVTKGDPEWGEIIGAEAKYEACQIPEALLENLTTEELLYMVEMYPFSEVIYLYDDALGFEIMRKNFNGLNELLSREDCKQVVLNKYANWEIPKETKFDYDSNISEENKIADMNAILKDEDAMKLVYEDARERYIIDIMEMILSCEEIQNEMTSKEVEVLSKELVEKAEMKENSECYENESSVCYYSGRVDTKNTRASVYVTLRTRNGTEIPYSSVAYPTQITESQALCIVGDTPGAEIVEFGNYGYNCFAYAWLSLDNANYPYRKYVLVQDQEVFIDDLQYKRSRKNIKVGNVVCWSKHAAVVAELQYTYVVTGGNRVTDIRVISKWGPDGPLVSHPLNQSPYGTPTEMYYK